MDIGGKYIAMARKNSFTADEEAQALFIIRSCGTSEKLQDIRDAARQESAQPEGCGFTRNVRRGPAMIDADTMNRLKSYVLKYTVFLVC